jgi:hypothetical protein
MDSTTGISKNLLATTLLSLEVKGAATEASPNLMLGGSSISMSSMSLLVMFSIYEHPKKKKKGGQHIRIF